MDDELHAAGFVEKPLEHDFLLARQCAERGMAGAEVIEKFLCRRFRQTISSLSQRKTAFAARIVLQTRREIGSQARDCLRQLVAASRRFAKPERNRRRHAVCIFDTNSTRSTRKML